MSLKPKEDPYKRRPCRSTATVSGAPGADASAGRADLMKAAPTQVLQHGNVLNAGCGGAGGGASARHHQHCQARHASTVESTLSLPLVICVCCVSVRAVF